MKKDNSPVVSIGFYERKSQRVDVTTSILEHQYLRE